MLKMIKTLKKIAKRLDNGGVDVVYLRHRKFN